MKQIYDKVLNIDISNEKKVKKIIDALNCKNRRDILNLLGNNIMSISEIADALNVPISTVSEHVKILINSGIVSKKGRNLYKDEIILLNFIADKLSK
jgi:DNA-binding transcriptional ArsR family regulator